MTEFGLNDIGNILRLTILEDGVAKDIQLATAKTYLIKKPDETVSEVNAVFDTNGSNGKVIYTFVTGDLDQVGLYEVQVKIVTASWTGISSSYSFLVRDTLTVTV